MVEKTIFQKIIDRELPAKIRYEDEDIICIDDAYPKAPVHILVISKKRIPSIHDVRGDDYKLLVPIFQKIQELAEEMGIADNYRVLTNRGPKAGQVIFHLHFHLLGGSVSEE